MKLIFDEVGYWTEIKLEIIKKYAKAYSEILSGKFHHIYIDAFAGAGRHRSKQTGDMISGSPLIVLDTKPPFKEYYFIDNNKAKVAELQRLAGNKSNVHIIFGDCNQKLISDVYPKVRWEDFRRGLLLIDPYGIHVRWHVMETAGKMKSLDVFLNFPVADMNRNVFWRNAEHVDPRDIARMDAFWGDNSWRKVAYSTERNLFGWEMKTDNETVAQAFKVRLQEKAGFKHVSEPLPMRNSVGAIIYYLFFASQQKLADGISTYIFNRYRDRDK
jgi:three-Cys-motif partner protein